MNTSFDRSCSECRILLVGAGGVGAPCAIALAEAGLGSLIIVDDDAVEPENLHRQLLFDPSDIGKSKPDAAERSLAKRWPALRVETVRGRALPATALSLVEGVHAVVDATDNFSSRFLLADACHLAGVAVVHAAAVRWMGTVACIAAGGTPCYRCLFEDLPPSAPDCATAGIIGPVCGVVGGIAAEMALDVATGRGKLLGKIATFDGRLDELRLVGIPRRTACPLCGDAPSISELVENRYMGPACAA
jgi:molybdopterin/thiamine biosynthesis adenylyltransferase